MASAHLPKLSSQHYGIPMFLLFPAPISRLSCMHIGALPEVFLENPTLPSAVPTRAEPQGTPQSAL